MNCMKELVLKVLWDNYDTRQDWEAYIGSSRCIYILAWLMGNFSPSLGVLRGKFEGHP